MTDSTWQKFLTLTEQLNSKDLDFWFDLLLTKAEKEDIKNRIEILKGLLDEHLPQRELSEKLKVSISNITRGSNALKSLSNARKTWLKKELLD